jgi:hypothetical protein
MLTSEYRIYNQENPFYYQIYENKGSAFEIPSSRYPSKGLIEGYPGACLLRKSLKTSWELEIPSKLYLLKDLARGIFEGGGSLSEWGCLRRNLEIVKRA